MSRGSGVQQSLQLSSCVEAADRVQPLSISRSSQLSPTQAVPLICRGVRVPVIRLGRTARTRGRGAGSGWPGRTTRTAWWRAAGTAVPRRSGTPDTLPQRRPQCRRSRTGGRRVPSSGPPLLRAGAGFLRVEAKSWVPGEATVCGRVEPQGRQRWRDRGGGVGRGAGAGQWSCVVRCQCSGASPTPGRVPAVL